MNQIPIDHMPASIPINPKFTLALLNSVLQSSPDGIVAFKSIRNDSNEISDFEWLVANEKAEKILNKKAVDLIGKRMLQVFPANKESGLFDKYVKVVNSGESAFMEQFYQEGELAFWLKVSVVKLGDGFTATFQDISEIKEAFFKVQTSELKYKQLFHNSIDPIFLVDHDYQIIDANRSFTGLFELGEDFLNMSFKDLFIDSTEFERFQTDIINANRLVEFETNLKTASGEEKICSINSIPLINRESHLPIIQGVIRDLTARIEAEKTLLEAEKLLFTGKIARTIAHEVRNPLTNLNLALEQLKDDLPENADHSFFLEIIGRNSKRIEDLITDLLDSSKSRDYEFEVTCLKSVMEETIGMISDRMFLQDMTLTPNFPAHEIMVQLDVEQIKVAFLNIMLNATEAMTAGTGELKIEIECRDDNVLIEFTDNGVGMTLETQKKLYDPFYTSRKRKGTGLGLNTVKNIINGHKGSITFKSAESIGTSFYVMLPTIRK